MVDVRNSVCVPSDFPKRSFRPNLSAGYLNASDSLAFMQVDVDYYFQPGPQLPVLRMYGVTEAGHSVAAHVHGFLPYFFVPRPGPDVDCERFKAKLESVLRSSATAASGGGGVVSVEIVKRTSMHGYSAVSSDQSKDFFKVTLNNPKLVSTARGIIERGIQISENGGSFSSVTFESSIPFPLRFMVDKGLSGGSWVEASKYTVRGAADRQTNCQLEVDISDWSTIIAHAPEGEWQKLAPLRILSFDLECMAEPGTGFPTADRAPVVQIAAAVKSITAGAGNEETNLVKVIFTLGSCVDIAGAHVYSFSDERHLLLSFREFVLAVDADILTGYNIINFDLPYLLDRALALKIQDAFALLGRLRSTPSVVKNSVFESRALGKRESKDINIDGRVQFDLLVVVQREYKLRSYSLNSVSAHFLNEQKEDVHYSIMADLQKGNAETRKRLAVYCLKDAVLPIRLLDKLLCLYNYIEMARVTGVPITYLLTRGQMIKVASQLYRKARSMDYLIPSLKSQGGGGEDGETFEGATVLDPTTGFYTTPIATLDFASLYPSIMIAHNLCYTTLISSPQILHGLPADSVTKTPCGHNFVKGTVRKGLLPLVLEELIAARKKVRKEMAETTDPILKMVMNGRQLALKISANSVYGFTGATIGMMPCLEISSSVTAFGRQMIDDTKRRVEDQYTVANGYANNAVVIYGDTDSVFVNFGVSDVAESMRLGEEAANEISKHFIKPIKLEFEKVYFPYLLMNKKRYAGMYWSKPEKFDKLDAKGIETVRRDNCELVRVVVERVLDIILKEMSIEKAVKYIQGVVSDLLQNKIDLSMLVISKSLGKGANAEDYAVKVAHVELAERMRARDPGTAPAVGDRVQYVLIKGSKNAKSYEKAEDPLYVLENNMSIDGEHYIEHQLKQPLLRIFENILPNAESMLFAGEHTRKVSNMTPTTGALAGFITKSLKCLSCKVVIKSGAFCDHCKGSKEVDVVQSKISEMRSLEIQFAKLWSQCQRCQGSLHQDVLCTSRDCPIFFRRARIRKDAASAAENMKRINEVADW